MSGADKLISRTDTSAATFAAERRARTGQRTSPYRSRPERETYSQIELYERADGTRYSKTREVSRWGGEYSFGEWTEAA